MILILLLSCRVGELSWSGLENCRDLSVFREVSSGTFQMHPWLRNYMFSKGVMTSFVNLLLMTVDDKSKSLLCLISFVMERVS